MTIDEIRDKGKDLLRALSDCTALRDIDGFAQELYLLADECELIFTSEESSESDAGEAEDFYGVLTEAAQASDEMLENYTQAHLALSRWFE